MARAELQWELQGEHCIESASSIFQKVANLLQTASNLTNNLPNSQLTFEKLYEYVNNVNANPNNITKMLYDLNVPWTPTTPPADLERRISFLSSLGYHTIALTHTLSASSIPSQIRNPIPLPVDLGIKIPPKVTILRRLTLTFSDPSQNYRLPALAAAYDILALRPAALKDRIEAEKAFTAVCNSVTEHSIISLDLTQRYPFHWKPKPFMTAINRGVRFEICYAQATTGNADSRRNFVGNFVGVVRATKGRGLVVSGEAGSVLAVRAPADVLNLLGVWGLGRERGAEGMGVNAREVVVNEGIKRSGFRGVIDVIEGGERVVEKKDVTEKSSSGMQGVGKKGKGKGKRPAEQENTDGTPQISKRQAKRMRLEALKAGKESAQKDTPSKSLPKELVSEDTSSKEISTPEESDTPSTIKAKANS